MSAENILHVAYLGPEASFSHQAALELFPSSANAGTSPPVAVKHHSLPSFPTIFSSLQDSSSIRAQSQPHDQHFDYAVLPIENSTNGSVVQVLDLLSQCGLHGSGDAYPDLEVCAEYYLPVHHCLFVHPSSSSRTKADQGQEQQPQFPSISTLYTHPQVWGQCGRFLSMHFPPNLVERVDMSSTSAAATLVAREGEEQGNKALSAAISSRLAGQKHNLVCLAENIEDSPGDNTTRFLVLRNRREKPRYGPYHSDLVSRVRISTGASSHSEHYGIVDESAGKHRSNGRRHKSLITFTIPHSKPGSLADALAVFKTHGFNLTSIDTRPSRRRSWQYVFFVECEEAASSASASATANGAASDVTSMNTHHIEAQDPGENLRDILKDLAKYTESLRYLGKFVDQLQTDHEA